MAEPTLSAGISPETLSHQEPLEGDGIPSLQAGVTPPTSASTTASTQPPRSAASSTATAPPASGVRQRINSLGSQLDAATEHPAVKNAKVSAQKQVGNFRQTLGKSPMVVNLEKRTGVDRVLLVVGGVLAYILFIPLNLFGLGLPVTTLLTVVPAAFLAMGTLEQPQSEASEAATKALLSYFVSLGFIQFIESLAGGILEKRIPQYYTVKLLFLAYLIHPKTQGAMKLHNSVFRKLFIRSSNPPMTTPPSSQPSGSSAPSPTSAATSPPSGPTL